MSYIKQIGNYIVKFKDEESYLRVKLEHLKDCYKDTPFTGFIFYEMYDKSKCEVESIDMMSSGNSTNNTISTDLGSGSSYNVVFSCNIVDGDMVPDGDLIPDRFNSYYGCDSWTVNEELGIDGISDKTKNKFNKKEEKIEEPDDPIENRFNILDLRL